LQCEYYALEGLGQLMGSVGLVREYLNPTLSIAGIVLTMYDGRTKLGPQVADEARTHFPELVFEAIIPRSVRISEAPSYSQTVLTYDPSSVGAKAYVACARELAKR
jgi:chromosome partitioning protein